MTIRFTAAQIDAPVLANPRFLERDLFVHLMETRPHLQACYPIPYLQWVVRDSMKLAAPFRFDLVAAYRMFLLLRFDIAPGFFKQDDIARGLADVQVPAMDRWSRLAAPEFGDAWLQARQFDGAGEWRTAFWNSTDD